MPILKDCNDCKLLFICRHSEKITDIMKRTKRIYKELEFTPISISTPLFSCLYYDKVTSDINEGTPMEKDPDEDC